MYFGTFHHQDPRSTNARAEFKGTGHTQLSSSRHFICKPTLPSQTLSNPTLPSTSQPNLIKPTLPSNTLQPSTNLTLLHLTPRTLFWTVIYTFIVYSIWCKTLFIVVVVVVYKFCCTYKSFVPFFKSSHPNLYCCLSKVYSFTKRRNKPGFSGIIKIPIVLSL